MFARWDDGDYEPRLTEFHRDVEIVSPFIGAAFEGHGGVRRWLGNLTKSFEGWHADLEQIHEVTADRVLAVGHLHLQGREKGDIDQPCAWLIDFQDGLVARIEAFPNRVDEALAVAGVEG
jgi:ketosteroid isomerase-like protein